jgi:hypothetical protein
MAVDISGVQPPPARPGTRRTSAATTRAANKAEKAAGTRQQTLEGYVQLFSLGLTMVNLKADAGAVEMHSPTVIPEVAKLADTNEKFAAFLDRAESVGPYWGLTMAILPLGLQILTNHKILKAEGTMGVVKPELLSAQIDTRQMQAAAQHAQMQAQFAQEAAMAEKDYREAMVAQQQAGMEPAPE